MNRGQFLWFVAALVSLHSVKGKQLCDFKDEKCLKKAAQNIYKTVSNGVKDLTEPLDPLFLEEIAGNLGNLKYQVSNASLTGLSNCEVAFIKCDTEKKTYEYHLQCPQLAFDYYYEAKGDLGPMNLDGRGLGTVTIDDYLLKMTGNYGLLTSEKDKTYITIINNNLETNLKGKLKYESKYLMHGDKAKSDLVKAYINENYKEMEKIFRSQILEKFVKIFVKTFDTYLRHYPTKEIIVSD